MVRGRLLVLEEDHHVLLLTAHHLIFDGWSQSLLLRELGTVYTALRSGQDVPLPELTWQYSDYTRWQWEWMAGEEPAAHADYWTGALAGVPALLPCPPTGPVRPSRIFTVAGWPWTSTKTSPTPCASWRNATGLPVRDAADRLVAVAVPALRA
ncbi:condensation domain-containing protein [Streptomyces sp. M10(2022)]